MDLVTTLSLIMTYVLYSYKPRSLSAPVLFLSFVYNAIVWIIIFGLIDLCIVFLVSIFRRTVL